jgi:ferrous iron transport protein B
LATLAAIRAESGHWKYALFTAAYTTGLAYLMAFVVYRVALFFL